MTYPLIPIGIIIFILLYILFQLIIKKNLQKVKLILYPGLFFTIIWVIIYFIWLG